MSNGAHNFCSTCGTRLEPGVRFCPSCGVATETAGPGATGGPAGPPPPAGPTPVAPGTTGSRPGVVLGVVAAVVVVIALVAGVVAFVVVGDDEASADEVALEPIAAATPDPFTGSVAVDEDADTAEVARLEPSGAAGDAGEQVGGATPGLYGGTRDAAACDPEQLVAFLESNREKARAWAGVLGITVTEIPDYVASLTPVVLTRDTRVTNHGYRDGAATTIPAVLQAGTAVMVDRFGVPRVKCGCGNPLTEASPVTSRTRYTGAPWPRFNPTAVVVVTVTVEVDTFVLVDVASGGLYTRPPGTDGADDGELAVDDLCDLFPDDPACREASTTTTSPPVSQETTPPTTATPTTRTPTTPPPTVPPSGDRADEAVWWIQEAIGACDGSAFEVITDISAYGSGDRYTVEVQLVLDSGGWTAIYTVDFATEDFPEVTPADPDSAALICQ